MKDNLNKLTLVILFAIAISGIQGCSNSADSKNAVTGGQSNGAGNTVAKPVTETGKKNSAYPPLAATIAAADLELIDGTTTKVDDRKGKVILLNLWGIWCGPCRVEMPHLVELQQTYGEKGLQIIGLNVGNGDMLPENIDAIKKFAADMKLNYELARIPNSMTSEFNKLTKFDGVPQTVLVDREGRLRGVFLGGGPTVIKKMKETVENVINE
ncbi:MAG: TlpA family protein disulfide reductase [Blastocatellia bacterium]